MSRLHGMDEKSETPYQWLEDNPWQDHQVKEYLTKDFEDLISCSKKYPMNEKWKHCTKEFIDLKKVSNDLPSFIQEMEHEKSNSYNELKNVIQELQKSPESKAKGVLSKLSGEKLLPLTREIIEKLKGNTPKQTPRKEKYTAQPLRDPGSDPKYHTKTLHVDEYMLRVSVPERRKEFLEKSGFTSDEPSNLTRRWIFIPSYMHAKCGLFDWSKTGIDEETTIRIIVVRPSEFEEYQNHCGNYLPIISLPNNELGVGYARYWIQKIATSMRLKYIWMIDDDVKRFFEVHPNLKPPALSDNEASTSSDPIYISRRRNFNEVFTKFESIVKANKGGKLAAISPVVWRRPNTNRRNAFVRKPPRVAVFLNLKLINDHNVSYRPQLTAFEDMLFGKECERENLKVIMWKRINVSTTGGEGGEEEERERERENLREREQEQGVRAHATSTRSGRKIIRPDRMDI